jgi:hypothetical protein
MPSDTSPRSRRVLGYLGLAAVAYLPVLFTSPGRVVADTKSYLYLDPGRLLERATSMWDPNIGLGTVTHQNIGYVFPMGPYYWAMHMLGVPAWVSQRLWLGTVLFLAALGVLYLLRTLHVRGPGVVAAAFVFMLSPYVLDFAARISVILLPWAGLPWMLALVIRALRDGGWRYPALFAIVVQLVGSVNATALVFVGVVPAMWVLYAWLVDRDVDWRRTLNTVARIAVLTLLASLWWIVGLAVQSGYGIEILRFTETPQTVAHASIPSEVIRGLGYWFFYGGDKISPWIDPSVRYTQDLWLMAVGYAIPLLAFAAACIVRWRHRAFFVLVAFVGFVISVGANPYHDPSVLGRLFKSFASSSSFGLALRSTARAVPLLALAVAVLIGLGVNALAGAWSARGLRFAGVGLAAAVVALAALNLPSLWTGDLYGNNLARDEDIPEYWQAAIADLDAGRHDTRVLEIPGADFASYRWGNTVDPITPGLMDRPYVARELVPWGSAATADLLNALDRRLQEGVLDPTAIAPIARLMGVGDVVYRADLQTDRFDLARALPTWLLLTQPVPDGLDPPKRYGNDLGPPLRFTQLDEIALAQDAAETQDAPKASTSQPPPVSVFAVRDARPIVRAAAADRPLIVAGDGEGLVDLAGLGGLGLDGVVLYSGSYADDPAALRREIARPGSVLVVTDSNRKRGRRWGAIKDIEGSTERVDESALVKDEGDARLDLFPGAGPSTQTVVESPGAEVSTTHVGNLITYWTELRGARAFDGDVDTAWQVGDHGTVRGQSIQVDLDEPITTDHVNLVQPLLGPRDRYITRATLTFDGEDPITVDLHDASRTAEGETVRFPRRSFERFEITIDDTNVGNTFDYPTSNNVGFAEIRLRDDAPGAQDVRVSEIVRMPTDLVDAAGARAADRPLVYEMSRSRTVEIPPRRGQDEEALVRKLRVPGARDFGVGGTARLSTGAPDDVIDRALGSAGVDGGDVTVRASEHLPGDVRARGSAAFDGDQTTAWSTAFGDPTGEWVEVQTPEPVTFDRLDLVLVADGRHSVPTQLRIDAGGESRTVDVEPVADGTAPGTTVEAPVTFDPLTGSDIRVTITAARSVATIEYHENQPIVMPASIAEVGISGVERDPLPSTFSSSCRDDLLSIDGEPLSVRLVGETATAQSGGAIDVQPCDGAVTLDAGDHVVRSEAGRATGVDVDGLVLGSDARGAAMTLGPGGSLARAVQPPERLVSETPAVRVVHDGRTKKEIEVRGAQSGTPFWLVLGQSNNAGWKATVDGSDASIRPGDGDDGGTSSLVDGYANGWLVTPTTGSFRMTLEWEPQQTVWIALVVSAVTLVLCVVLACWRRRRRTDGASYDDAGTNGVDPPVLAGPLVATGRNTTRRVTIVTTIGAGFVAAFVARWWVGVVVAVCVLAVLLRPRLRFLLTLGAPACIVITALYVIVQQYRYRYPYGYFWVEKFGAVANVVWLGVLLLAADAVVELVRNRRHPHPHPHGFGVSRASYNPPRDAKTMGRSSGS